MKYLLVACVLLPFWGANAQETDNGIICDTENELVAVMQSDDMKEAVAIIDNSIPDACAYATVKFYRGKYTKLIKRDEDTLEVTPIYVLAIQGEAGFLPVTHDNVQWSAFKSELQLVTDLENQWANSPNHEWYNNQQLTPQTRKLFYDKYGTSWTSCCDHGDVCQECVVVHYASKPPWGDSWWYVKDGVERPIPPHIVDYVPWTPTGKPVLFLYPYDEGPMPKGSPTCLKIPGGSS